MIVEYSLSIDIVIFIYIYTLIYLAISNNQVFSSVIVKVSIHDIHNKATPYKISVLCINGGISKKQGITANKLTCVQYIYICLE